MERTQGMFGCASVVSSDSRNSATQQFRHESPKVMLFTLMSIDDGEYGFGTFDREEKLVRKIRFLHSSDCEN